MKKPLINVEATLRIPGETDKETKVTMPKHAFEEMRRRAAETASIGNGWGYFSITTSIHFQA